MESVEILAAAPRQERAAMNPHFVRIRAVRPEQREMLQVQRPMLREGAQARIPARRLAVEMD
jgi:hypothetical protein